MKPLHSRLFEEILSISKTGGQNQGLLIESRYLEHILIIQI